MQKRTPPHMHTVQPECHPPLTITESRSHSPREACLSLNPQDYGLASPSRPFLVLRAPPPPPITGSAPSFTKSPTCMSECTSPTPVSPGFLFNKPPRPCSSLLQSLPLCIPFKGGCPVKASAGCSDLQGGGVPQLLQGSFSAHSPGDSRAGFGLLTPPLLGKWTAGGPILSLCDCDTRENGGSTSLPSSAG